MVVFVDEMTLNRKPPEFAVKPTDLISEFIRYIM